ncbi:UNKNOWN [Stylonychia lemnae]|uniref:Uncharacterized protein n=1 Tax=Stylonychia lemnae TaxID=5949 RepID=A0A078AL30_STYLE|nr:UNKNOWN [Stylonychia lemnae]|eukprot:CDW82884.1 UNKNOWN [Stylonychia lemnae]
MAAQISPDILEVRSSTGEIFILYADLNERGSIDLVCLMGIRVTQDQQIGIFVTGFFGNNPSTSGLLHNANALVNYDAIIPQMSDGKGYIVGCLESQALNKPLLGMVIHQYYSGNFMVTYRNVAETQNSFQCLAVIVAQRNDIQVVYKTLFENQVRIIIAKMQSDPFDAGKLFDNVIYEDFKIPNDNIYPRQFKYLYNDINDYFHLGSTLAHNNQQSAYFTQLNSNTYYSIIENQDQGKNQTYQQLNSKSSIGGSGTKENIYNNSIIRPAIDVIRNNLAYVKLWRNQSLIGENDYNVSQLIVKQVRIPENLSSVIDCSLEIQNNDVENVGFLRFFNQSQDAFMTANISTKFNEITKIGLFQFNITYQITDGADPANRLILAQDMFTLNVTNRCQEEFKIIKDIKDLKIRYKISTDVEYYQIPQMKLGPAEECFNKKLAIILDDNSQMNLDIIKSDHDRCIYQYSRRLMERVNTYQYQH